MRHAEILKGGERTDCGGHQIIGEEQKRPDKRDYFAAMTDARVNTAAIRVKTADDHVIDADERGQHTHQGDEPEGGVTCNGEYKTDDVGLARAPIAVEDRSGPFPIDIAWTFNVGRDH